MKGTVLGLATGEGWCSANLIGLLCCTPVCMLIPANRFEACFNIATQHYQEEQGADKYFCWKGSPIALRRAANTHTMWQRLFTQTQHEG